MVYVSIQTMTEYLRQIVEIESSVYSQEEVIKKAHQEFKLKESRRWENSGKLSKPDMPRYETEYNGVSCIIGGIVLLGVSFVFGLNLLFLENLFLLLLVIFTGVFGAYMIDVGWKTKAVKESNRKKREEYEEAMKKYEGAYMKEKERDSEQYEITKKNYKEMVLELEKVRDATKKVLQKLYSVGWIYPKYRNMIAMCTIYEYFSSGRVTALAGPDGAYNLYESELRQNMIVNRLDQIISQLEEIKNNQYTLYLELRKTNRILEGVAKDIQQMRQMANLIAFRTGNIEVNVRALRYFKSIIG
ncbi:MAG: hypothetical protein IJZ53_12500 [Tyzzerella sp.]|nr:hypothetical protein [Tyzzerella sp.]